ncbi:B- and T-lymphocyte attenuator-like [Poeciliopsis prolifica]|uniref:B- and T-lymphocyte attenuator-like n=1 Tax=Poeciliopsis prolifica TaxID=188132 RepID=UPI002414053D|nr:B- and T-lymphocyte attenuator-like [Poeciliopsis prolifica]
MSNSFRVFFFVLFSIILIVPLDADDDECTTELRVRRNTIYEASLGQELRIECPLVFCDNLLPTICWSKVEEDHICLNKNNNNHIKTEWKISNPPKGIFYLIFQSIISSDSGGYQCKGGGSLSHIIYINIHGTNEDTTTEKATTNVTNDQSETGPADRFLMFSYSTAGIGSFVIVVFIISIICMRGSKGKSDGTEIQYSPTQGDVKKAEEFTSVVYKVCQEGKVLGR